MLLAFLEALVLEALLILRVPCLVKVIHVELPDERREVVVLEVLREHLFTELVHLFDHEAVTVFVPADYLIKSWVRNEIKGFQKERRDLRLFV